MTAEWYYRVGQQEYGPLTAVELQRLAQSGQLQPTDEVRKDPAGPWIPAARIKGLPWQQTPLPVAVPATAETSPGRGLENLPERPTIDVSRCFGLARAHYVSVLWPMMLYLLLLNLVNLIALIPCFGAILLLLIEPPLFAGWVIVSLDQLKGRPWTFGRFFAGFGRDLYGPLLVNALLLTLILLLLMSPSLVVFIVHTVFYQVAKALELDRGALGRLMRDDLVEFFPIPFAVLNAVPAVIYLWVRSFFCMPLIVDRGCSAVEAIRGSWRLSRGHFWRLFAVILLVELIGVAGLLACGVGLLFAFPFVTLVISAVYLEAVGKGSLGRVPV